MDNQMALTKTKTRTMKSTQSTINKYPGIFKSVEDITIPDILFNPTRTGTPEIDKSFSEMGGITPSCVTLVTGTPGAGKTTLMATVGARLQTARPVVFLSYEMSDFQTKLTAKKIQGFEKMLIVTETFHKESREEFEKFLFGPLQELNPSLVIVDSLQKMAGVMAGSYNNNQIWLTEKFTEFAKKTFVPVNLIGHVSKDGTYKGPTTIKHEVDAHMHISIDKELGERVFSFSKNRFGGVGDPFIFRITSHGVYIGEEWWLKAAENGDEGIADMAITAIHEFTAVSKKSDVIPFKAFQKMAKTVHKYLEHKYHTDLKDNSVSGKTAISLGWKGARAYCQINTGRINYGERFFKKITNSNWQGVGYKSEKAFIGRHCQSKEQVALWVIIHEFTHLFKGCGKHTKSFFKKVENYYMDAIEKGLQIV